jgi:uncharacterized membrane protein
LNRFAAVEGEVSIGPTMGALNRLVLFATPVVVATFLALNNIGELPEKVAIHFGENGLADGWTSRENYRLYVLFSLIVVPSLLVWLMAGLPRLTKGRGQIPNAEYWFAQERRQTTEAFLINHACWLGIMTVAIVYGIHLSIVRANAISPPALATDRFITMVVIYLCGLVWWLTAFLRHFQRMDRHN